MNGDNVTSARTAVPIVLAVLGSRPQDVFHADETRLVLGRQPTKMIGCCRVAGVKMDLDRISVMRCSNLSKLRNPLAHDALGAFVP